MAQKPTLTHAQMAAVIDAGGSIVLDGVVMTHKSQLPTEAQLAKGDPEKEAAVKSDLEARIADLEAQLTILKPPTDAAAAPAEGAAVDPNAEPVAPEDETKK